MEARRPPNAGGSQLALEKGFGNFGLHPSEAEPEDCGANGQTQAGQENGSQVGRIEIVHAGLHLSQEAGQLSGYGSSFLREILLS